MAAMAQFQNSLSPSANVPPWIRERPPARMRIKTLQENMGHFSAAFTLDKYGHVVDEMRKASSGRMQKLIESMSM